MRRGDGPLSTPRNRSKSRASHARAIAAAAALALGAAAGCGDADGHGPDGWTLVSAEAQSFLHSQGLASAPDLGPGALVFASQFTIDRTDADGRAIQRSSLSPALRAEGYDHLGDIDAHGGVVYGPIEDNLPPAPAVPHRAFALYDVVSLDLVVSADDPGRVDHPPDGDNSWVAVSPDGAWLLTSEWSPQTSLIVYDTAALGRGGVVEPVGAIPLDRAIRRAQGCDFDGPGRLLCASDDDAAGRPVYALDLDRPLDAASAPATRRATVSTLFATPTPPGECGVGPTGIEVEGIDVEGDTMRLIVLGPCALDATLYTYRRE